MRREHDDLGTSPAILAVQHVNLNRLAAANVDAHRPRQQLKEYDGQPISARRLPVRLTTHKSSRVTSRLLVVQVGRVISSAFSAKGRLTGGKNQKIRISAPARSISQERLVLWL